MPTLGGRNLILMVSLRLSGAGLGNIQFKQYLFVLDISCQHSGEEFNFEGFSVHSLGVMFQGLSVLHLK